MSKIIFDIAAIIVTYSLGYLVGFKNGVKTILSQIQEITDEFFDRAKIIRAENKDLEGLDKWKDLMK